MKKFLVFVFAIGFSVNFVSADFADTHGENCRDAAEFLLQYEIVNEAPIFRPNDPITRAEFLKLTLLSAKKNISEDCQFSKNFTDIYVNDWHYKFICFAENNDIVSGYQNGNEWEFHPNDPIIFRDASKIVAEVFDIKIPEIDGLDWEKYLAALDQEKILPKEFEGEDLGKVTKKIKRGETAQILWGQITGNEVINADRNEIVNVKNCDELAIQFEKFQKRQNGRYFGAIFDDGLAPEGVSEPMLRTNTKVPTKSLEFKKESLASDAADDFSETNVQELGVDEADIIKNDGSHIFLITKGTVRIVRAFPPESLEQEAILSFEDSNSFDPQEMFLGKNTLTVVGTGQADWREENKIIRRGAATKVFIFNISDRKNPKQIKQIEMEGNYVSSRRVGKLVYLVVNKQHWGNFSIDILPRLSDSKNSDDVLASSCAGVSYFPNFTDSNFTIISAINTEDPEKKVEREVLLGAGNEIYASTQNLFVTRPVWDEVLWEKDGISRWQSQNFTEIFKFSLGEKINFVSKGRVIGRILNQFSMSEFSKNFRIATHDDYENTNGIYILDENLDQISEIENIAPGEQIKSVRFMGNRGFLVTFKNVDPFFVVDLSPNNPKILGELKIPGWSDYLHPIDEKHLLGFGREVDPAAEARGRLYSSDLMGMKMSIFDVTDLDNPKETHKVVIGDSQTSSELLRNHKALLFDVDKKIVGFPIEIFKKKTDNSERHYSETEKTFSGAQIYNFDLKKGFSLRGSVSHFPGGFDFSDWNKFYEYDQDFNISRIIFIGQVFYTISGNVVRASEWDDLKKRKELVLDTKTCSEISDEDECNNRNDCEVIFHRIQECDEIGCSDPEQKFLRCEKK